MSGAFPLKQTIDSAATPIVVAAGGAGSRIGGDKPLRLLGGQPLLDHVLAIARRYGTQVAVAGDAALAPALSVQPDIWLADDVADAGPRAALSSALGWTKQLGASHALLIGCDLPFLPDDLCTRLTMAAHDAPDQPIVPVRGGQWHMLAALWPVAATQAAIPAWQNSGRRSLMALARSMAGLAVDWDDAGLDPFFNINSADDLAEAERRLAGSA